MEPGEDEGDAGGVGRDTGGVGRDGRQGRVEDGGQVGVLQCVFPTGRGPPPSTPSSSTPSLFSLLVSGFAHSPDRKSGSDPAGGREGRGTRQRRRQKRLPPPGRSRDRRETGPTVGERTTREKSTGPIRTRVVNGRSETGKDRTPSPSRKGLTGTQREGME